MYCSGKSSPNHMYSTDVEAFKIAEEMYAWNFTLEKRKLDWFFYFANSEENLIKGVATATTILKML